MDILFERNDEKAHKSLVVGIFENKELSNDAKRINTENKEIITEFLKYNQFEGKVGEVSTLTLFNPYRIITLVGLGKLEDLSSQKWQEVGASLFPVLWKAGIEEIYCSFLDNRFLNQAVSVAEAAAGFHLRSWFFDHYKTKNKKEGTLRSIVFFSENPSESQNHYTKLKAINQGVFTAREVISEPANILYPASMAERAKALESLGVKVEILGEEEMKNLGMKALLGVGQGSEKESQLIVLQWMGKESDEAPIAIVGKGVTFDTGGISIKPSNNMEDMKYDMAGSAVVLGLIESLALQKAPVNVVGVMGMVENMPSGSAQRPSDVVKSLSGQTIEIVNTDAEGRLVLADALWYTQERFKPCYMIDLATLTGAIVVALGHEYAGLFSNNEDLAKKLQKASEETQELVWRLPLSANYDKDIDSDIADVKNVGSGRGAGSTTAAQFLQRFVNNTPWAHLDIAGVTWEKKGTKFSEKGATGFGVRLLNNLILSNFKVL